MAAEVPFDFDERGPRQPRPLSQIGSGRFVPEHTAPLVAPISEPPRVRRSSKICIDPFQPEELQGHIADVPSHGRQANVPVDDATLQRIAKVEARLEELSASIKARGDGFVSATSTMPSTPLGPTCGSFPKVLTELPQAAVEQPTLVAALRCVADVTEMMSAMFTTQQAQVHTIRAFMDGHEKKMEVLNQQLHDLVPQIAGLQEIVQRVPPSCGEQQEFWKTLERSLPFQSQIHDRVEKELLNLRERCDDTFVDFETRILQRFDAHPQVQSCHCATQSNVMENLEMRFYELEEVVANLAQTVQETRAALLPRNENVCEVLRDSGSQPSEHKHSLETLKVDSSNTDAAQLPLWTATPPGLTHSEKPPHQWGTP